MQTEAPSSKRQARWHITRARRTLLLMVVAWAVILSAFAIARHERLNSSAYDLAIKSQVIWNIFQGRFFASSIEVEHYLGDHVQLIMLLLAPFYGLWADVKILLIVQAILLSLGAIPVYRIAHRTLDDSVLALAFAGAYLLYPTIGFVNRFGFHPLTFVILFLLLAFDLLQRQRPVWATFFVLLALLCREDVGFTVFALGLYAALAMRRRLLGTAWAITGLTWSLTAIFVIIPYFRGEASDTVSRYAWLGSTLPQIAQTLLAQPGLVLDHILGQPFRLLFLVKLLLPVGFLALLSPTVLLIGLPALGYNLLSSTPSQSSIYFQYISPVIPFLFIAAMQGAARLRQWLPTARQKRRVIVVWLGTSVLVAWILDNPFTQTVAAPYFPVYALEQFSDRTTFLEARQHLPADAPVATMMAYGPHLSLRPELHLFYDRLRLEERQYGFPKTEYALLNLTDLRWGVNARIFYAAIETAVGRYGYEALYFKNDVVLLRQSAEPQTATGAVLQRVIALQEAGGKYAPTAQSTLAWMGQQWLRQELPTTAEPKQVQFESEIALLGYELSPKPFWPGRPLCATLYWQAEAVLDTDYTVFVHFVDDSGYVHNQRDNVPAVGFYPTSQWQPGQIVADMHCLQLPPNLTPGPYGLNVGLYEPNSGQRLGIKSEAEQPAPGALRLTPVQVAAP